MISGKARGKRLIGRKSMTDNEDRIFIWMHIDLG
jgi:hypothetical protein